MCIAIRGDLLDLRGDPGFDAAPGVAGACSCGAPAIELKKET
jgi:hypothetical protein